MPSFLGKDSYSSSIILGRVFSTNSKKGVLKANHFVTKVIHYSSSKKWQVIYSKTNYYMSNHIETKDPHLSNMFLTSPLCNIIIYF
jgi:hypothetical protein